MPRRYLFALVCLALFQAQAIGQIRGLEKGSMGAAVKAFRNSLQSDVSGPAKKPSNPYLPVLRTFWQSNTFDPSADHAAEYRRLAIEFRKHLMDLGDIEVAALRDVLSSLKRGYVRDTIPKPIVEEDGRFYFNHRDAKDKAVARYQKILETAENRLATVTSTAKFPHIPIGAEIMADGQAFYVRSFGVVQKHVNANSIVTAYRSAGGKERFYRIDGVDAGNFPPGQKIVMDRPVYVQGVKTVWHKGIKHDAQVLHAFDVAMDDFYLLHDID